MEIKIEKALPEDAENILEYLKIVGGETDNLTFGAEGMPISIEEERDYIASLLDSTSSVMLWQKEEMKLLAMPVLAV